MSTEPQVNNTESVWARLNAAPHRAFFAAGCLALVLLSVWWLGKLFNPIGGAYPALMVHGLLMPLGVFPLFMLGFIFTAGPRWINAPTPGNNAWLAVLYLLGLILALDGFSQGGRAPVIGLALMLLVFLMALWRWTQCLRLSQSDDKRHARRVWVGFLAGALTLVSGLGWVMMNNAMGQVHAWLFAKQLAFFGFLLPVFLTVGHRMIPFFTQSALPQNPAWRPLGLLNGWLAGCAVLLFADWLPGLLTAFVAFALAASFAYTSCRWGLRASLQNRLLAMLHLSFAWLTPALMLYGLSAAGVGLGAAPTHALALGFGTTLMVGFVTRVSLGHSGQKLVADRGFWLIYLGLHLVALLRVVVAMFALPLELTQLAGAGWMILLLLWVVRILPLALKARQDGKPG